MGSRRTWIARRNLLFRPGRPPVQVHRLRLQDINEKCQSTLSLAEFPAVSVQLRASVTLLGHSLLDAGAAAVANLQKRTLTSVANSPRNLP
jgi:hypothetical protein